MSLTYNGAEVKEIVYNGTALNQMDYNGVTVFKKDDWSDKPYVAFIEENGEQFTLQMSEYDSSGISRIKSWDGTLYYSIDGETWSTWSGTTQLSSSNDGKLYLRGKNNTYLTHATVQSATRYYRFALQNGKRIQCHGNIENLLNYETVAAGNHPTMASFCYYNMFRSCKSLTTAPELSAATVTGSCYYNMFYGCTSLTTAPKLPSTTLNITCYRNMFYGCTSLTTAPKLPATTLANNCYYNMFKNCTALTGQIHLPASVASNSYKLTDSDISGSSATIVFDL